MLNRVLVLCLGLFLVGCEQPADEQSQKEKSEQPAAGTDGRKAEKMALKQRVDTFFSAESRGDWRTVYEMRSPGFRKAVPFKSFERERSRFRKTWTLSDWTLRSVELDGDRATATVVLKGRTTEPTLIYMSGEEQADFNTKYRTKWIRREGTWYCLDEGVRFGSPFGIDMSIDTDFESHYEWKFEKPEPPPIPKPGENNG